MADNVTTQSGTLATIPASTKISTDEDATNGHVQRMKLAVSADGSSTHVGADADGLQVQGAAADGAAVAGNPVLVAGTDGTNAQTVSTNASGHVNIADGGNTITVDGTVTANLGATDNAVLDSIDANLTNTISTNNSTTSTLTGAATYTGTGDDVSTYTAVTIQLDASHDSATDGMTFQFSTDNSNWDDVYTFTYTAANGARRFQFPITAQYFRVVYTNGGSAQTHFRVQTILHRHNQLSSVHRLVDNTSPDRSAQVVKSAVIAQAAGTGDFVPVQATASGNLKVALEENDAGNLTVNVAQIAGTATSTGNGATDAGTQRVTISSDSTGVLSVDDNGGSLTVDAASLPLPTGAATAANQLPDGHNVTVDNAAGASAVNIQDGGNSITVDNGGTFAVQSTLQANSGVDIGDVDVTSVVPGTAATNLGKAIDSAAGATDTGVASLAVRDDSLSALTPAEGDYVPLRVNSTGALHVTGGGGGVEYTEDDAAAANPTGSAQILIRTDTPAGQVSADGDNVARRGTNYGAALTQIVDSSGNFINSFGGSGGTSHADDAAFSIGSASSITPTGYLADDTTPDSVDEGDVGVPRMTLTRKPYAVITDATSENNAAVDGSGHLQVDIAADSVGIGGGTEYAADDALGATPTGKVALAQRDDALSALTPVEGDAVPLRTDANGALWVIPSGTVTVDGSGVTQPVSGTVTANLSATDNAVLDQIELNTSYGDSVGGGTEAAALRVTIANNSTGVLSVDDNGSTLSIDDGGGNISVDWGGTAPPIGAGLEATALRVTLATDSTGVVSVDDNGGSLTVDVGTALPAGDNNIGNVDIASSVALDVSAATVTVDSELPAAAALADNTANPTVPGVGSFNHVWDGATWDRMPGTSADGVTVNLGTNNDVTVTSGTVTANAGTGTFTVDLGANNDVVVTGNAADDAAASGNPVLVAGYAIETDGTDPGTVSAEGDVAQLRTDRNRRLLVNHAHPNLWQAMGLYTTAQTDVSVKAAPGAGLSLYITDIVVSTDTAMSVFFEQSTTKVYGTLYLAANGGASSHFQTPIRLPANTALTFTSSATGNHSVTVNGYTAP